MQRFDFGIPELSDGIGVVVVAMGLFGFAEIIINLESTEKRELVTTKVKRPVAHQGAVQARLRRRCCAAPASGSVLGILPGGGAMLSSFASYTVEKKIAKDPSQFGKGAIQGVAGPGVGQQRRRADVVHSAADARHSGERGDGDDGRRDDHPQHPARARR